MKTILEIPVIGAHNQYFESYIGSKENIEETQYHDFVLLKYELDDNHIIYFYLLTSIPEVGNTYLVNQIIPQAPFSFILIEAKEGLQEEESRKLAADYCKNYSTPAFVIVEKDPLEFYLKIENDPMVKSNNIMVILVEENSEQFVKQVITEAIKQLTPADI